MAFKSLGQRFRYQRSSDIGVGGPAYGILQFKFRDSSFQTVGTFHLSWLPEFISHSADLRAYLKEHTDAVRWARK